MRGALLAPQYGVVGLDVEMFVPPKTTLRGHVSPRHSREAGSVGTGGIIEVLWGVMGIMGLGALGD